MPPARILGEPAWEFHSDRVSAALTRDGGHLGPVEFDLPGRGVVRPFHVAPWAGASARAVDPPVLRVLRGDFFCMPFGGNTTPWKGERHPVHGETANARWTLRGIVSRGHRTMLTATLKTAVRAGGVAKILMLHAGHTVVYSRHVISGMRGPMPVGHHAMLHFPEGETGRVSCSPFQRGQVFPGEFERPAEGGYSCLKPGAHFRTLERVPRADGGHADLTTYPAREGYEDLVMLGSRGPGALAWTTAVFPRQGYVWFSLKDRRVLPSTVLWHSNGGRHYPPWSGRHRRVLGLEEVAAYFHTGLAESAAPNPWRRVGIPTALNLTPEKPAVVNVIMGVAAAPRGFDITQNILPCEDRIVLVARSGAKAECRLDPGFLQGSGEEVD